MRGSLFKSTGILTIYSTAAKILLTVIWWEGDHYNPNFLFQFQQHKYASLMWFKCGKKGYGLKAVEDISKGKFLFEYVGEVS